MQREIFRSAFEQKIFSGQRRQSYRIQANGTTHWRANFNTRRILRLPGLNDHFLTASTVALFSSSNCDFVTDAAFTLPSGPISTCSVIEPAEPLRRSGSG